MKTGNQPHPHRFHSDSQSLNFPHSLCAGPCTAVSVMKSKHLAQVEASENEEWGKAQANDSDHHSRWGPHMKNQNWQWCHRPCPARPPHRLSAKEGSFTFAASPVLGVLAALCCFFLGLPGLLHHCCIILHLCCHMCRKITVNGMWTSPIAPTHEIVCCWVIGACWGNSMSFPDHLQPTANQFYSMKSAYVQLVNGDESFKYTWKAFMLISASIPPGDHLSTAKPELVKSCWGQSLVSQILHKIELCRWALHQPSTLRNTINHAAHCRGKIPSSLPLLIKYEDHPA